jgi:hypothetical protein
VSGQLLAPTDYLQGESPWYPLDRRMDGPQNRSKSSHLPPEIESPNPDRPVRSQSLYSLHIASKYEGVSKSFRTGRLKRELQMVQLSATRYSCIAILWVSLMSFVAITLCVTSRRVSIFVYLSTQSGEFWIHPRRSHILTFYTIGYTRTAAW